MASRKFAIVPHEYLDNRHDLDEENGTQCSLRQRSNSKAKTKARRHSECGVIKDQESIRKSSSKSSRSLSIAHPPLFSVLEEEGPESLSNAQVIESRDAVDPTPVDRTEKPKPKRQRSKSTIFGLDNNAAFASPSGTSKETRLRSISVIDSNSSRLAKDEKILAEELLKMKSQFDELFSMMTGRRNAQDIVYKPLVKKRGDKLSSDESDYEHRNARSAAQIFSVIGIAIGHILDGNVLAYTSPAIPSMKATDSQFTDKEYSLIRSSFAAGAVVACLMAGSAMSYLGRRGSTLFITIPAYVSGFLTIATGNSASLIILGRFISGLGLGMTLSVPTVYIVEVTSPRMRGVLAVIPNLLCQLGIFSTYVAGRFLNWHALALACATLGVPFLVSVWLIPESPTYLVKIGATKQARRVLHKLDLDYSKQAIERLQEDLTKEELRKTNFWTSWTRSEVVRPFFTGLTLMAFFQGTIFPILMGNSLEIFHRMSLKRVSDHLANVVVGIFLVLGSIMAVPLARHFRRKTLLVVSAIGVSSCLFVMASYFYLHSLEMAEDLGWIPLCSFLIYILFFMSGYGSVSWLVVAEILPSSVRSMIYPFAIAGTWMFNFLIQYSYAPLMNSIGLYGLLWLYAAITALGTVFVASCLPETRSRSEEEIARFFSSSSSILSDVSVADKDDDDIV